MFIMPQAKHQLKEARELVHKQGTPWKSQLLKKAERQATWMYASIMRTLPRKQLRSSKDSAPRKLWLLIKSLMSPLAKAQPSTQISNRGTLKGSPAEEAA
jgi:hypothetical protein